MYTYIIRKRRDLIRMNIFGLNIEKRSDPVITKDEYWIEIPNSTDAGISVTPEKAMQHSTVYACVRIIAETLASIPLLTYRKLKGGGKERASDLDIYHILNYAPNDMKMSRVEFVEMLTAHCLLRGNSFAQIIGDNIDVSQLIPLPADTIQVKIRDNQLVYIYTPTGSNKSQEIPSKDMLHIKGLSFDGLVGLSPITYQRNMIANALGKEMYESALFKSGVQLSGVLEHPAELSAAANQRIAESFSAAYGGIQNARKVAILEEGMKFRELSMTNDEAQFLESRNFSQMQICQIFRVPPYMVADLSRASTGNYEQNSMEFIINCIRPWAVRLESAINRDILSRARRKGIRDEIFCEFLLDSILRGDTQARYSSYKTAIGSGILCINEAREYENLNPIDGGERYFVPANNLVPLDRIDDFLDRNSSANDLNQLNNTGAGKDSNSNVSDPEPTPDNPPSDSAKKSDQILESIQRSFIDSFDFAIKDYQERERDCLVEKAKDITIARGLIKGELRKKLAVAVRQNCFNFEVFYGAKANIHRADFVEEIVTENDKAFEELGEIKEMNRVEKLCYLDTKRKRTPISSEELSKRLLTKLLENVVC